MRPSHVPVLAFGVSIAETDNLEVRIFHDRSEALDRLIDMMLLFALEAFYGLQGELQLLDSPE